MPIEISGLAPLIEVFDMPASVHFYRDILGFELAMTSEEGDYFDWALLRGKGVALMLNTAYERDERPPSPDPARVAAHKDTALYFDCPNPEAAYDHLLAKGLKVRKPVVTHYGMKQVYVLDPDGYNVCFQCPAEEQLLESTR